jgi:3-hydroxybutyryl-CoA dehydrogenase
VTEEEPPEVAAGRGGERLGIVGGGAIACGLAAVRARDDGDVIVWVRGPDSRPRTVALLERLAGEHAARVRVETDLDALGDRSFVVEAIVEDEQAKRRHLAESGDVLAGDAILATTTSSLSVAGLADASGRPDRFVGLHVFNPVTKMELVELAFPPSASASTRTRARMLCEALGKTAVEVPDVPGFVVNRLLFPYLFGAVRLLEQTGMPAEDVDTCMRLGAGHPMGPLALLDLVGLDVAIAIGDALDEPIPDRLRELAAEGALGRKAGRGFHPYEKG